jgi:hypothetical protein
VGGGFGTDYGGSHALRMMRPPEQNRLAYRGGVERYCAQEGPPMTTVAKTRRGRKEQCRNHFERMEGAFEEGHPIDLAVARRVRLSAKRRRLVRLQARILGRLETASRKVFLQLEDLRNSMGAEVEEAYFNVGYEHGLADARARQRRGVERETKLAREIRERIVRAHVPPRRAALGLIECLWAVLGAADDRVGSGRDPARKATRLRRTAP